MKAAASEVRHESICARAAGAEEGEEEEQEEEKEEQEQEDADGLGQAAAAAVRQAAAEGLVLERSERSNNSTGFTGVTADAGAGTFRARLFGADSKQLGKFATAEQAALACARARAQAASGAQKVAGQEEEDEDDGDEDEEEDEGLTAMEALRQASVEGLTLERSDSATGFVGVSASGQRYRARIGVDRTHLGTFATAEEAALAFARAAAAEGNDDDDDDDGGMSEDATAPGEALRQAAAEGLEIERSDKNSTGFKGVSTYHRGFRAEIYSSGKRATWRSTWFATAEQAALARARTLASEQYDDDEEELDDVQANTFVACGIVLCGRSC